MKAQFKSAEMRQKFIDYGEDRWAFNSTRHITGYNNNRKIAKKVGMAEFDVVKVDNKMFNGWYDIFIDGEPYDSIADDEVIFFNFID